MYYNGTVRKVDKMVDKNRSIGIFDSGMGGISVLGEAIRWLPTENFIYYGDSANAPYGSKTKEEVTALSEAICDHFIERDVKAIVIACNTATSAAVDYLRAKYADIPVIGIEPALKPAVESVEKGAVLVLATEMTLKETKFLDLCDRIAKEREVIKLPCPSFVTMVEEGIVDGIEAEKEVRNCLGQVSYGNVKAVVLGCTHFVFLRHVIAKVMGPNVEIFDGNVGTVKHLLQTLEERGDHEMSRHESTIEIINSGGMELVLQSQKLLNLYKPL
jgi:glutamate racemase